MREEGGAERTCRDNEFQENGSRNIICLSKQGVEHSAGAKVFISLACPFSLLVPHSLRSAG